MNIRPDQINFLSTLPNYINIGNLPGNIAISGTVADGTGRTFSVTIPTSTSNTRFDVYGVNKNTNTKQLLSNTGFPVIYQNSAGEDVTSEIIYSPNSITVEILVDNFTGGSVTLITQTIVITVVEYQIPY